MQEFIDCYYVFHSVLILTDFLTVEIQRIGRGRLVLTVFLHALDAAISQDHLGGKLISDPTGLELMQNSLLRVISYLIIS
jgi:hypothetical protein